MAVYDEGHWLPGQYPDDGELLGGYHPDSIVRIAIRAAANVIDKTLPHSERKEICLGAIIDYLCEWQLADPPPVRDLFRAAGRAVEHESYTYKRDHCFMPSGPDDGQNLAQRRWVMFWLTAPKGDDFLGEGVAERIGVRQLLGGLKPEHAEAVQAFADTQWDDEHGHGSYERAAAWLDITEPILRGRVVRARKDARRLWLAPDETPRPKWGADRAGTYTRSMNVMTRTLHKRKAAARKKAAGD